MRSQTTKSLPKKGALNKTTFKSNSPNKQNKRKNPSTKKVKKIQNKPSVKTAKKFIKDDVKNTNKKDEDISLENKNESQTENVKAGSSKSSQSRSNSPLKKNKNESKEKKETPKPSEILPKKSTSKKSSSQSTKVDKFLKTNIKNKDEGEVKYKLNSDIMRTSLKNSKAKNIIKKTVQKKKVTKPFNKSDDKLKDISKIEYNCNVKFSEIDEERKVCKVYENKDKIVQNRSENQHTAEQLKEYESSEAKLYISNDDNVNTSSVNTLSTSAETTKPESERPPKFFTSTRSPRTVDIDVKCCKTAKGILSVSERFVSMKCVEPKNDDNNKDSSNLVSQGSDIDVYTFTDKVDSPKSILSGFRNPISKNIGRVRPIARVKGTVIDKNKTDVEKKKYSPHRPIEEVVKQLKANKKSEELKNYETVLNDNSSSGGTDTTIIKSDEEEKPKPIVSKSYKMVARKTSIPGKPFSPIKFLDQDATQNTKNKCAKNVTITKKSLAKVKKKKQKVQISDEELETSKFSFNTKSKIFHYSSSEDSVSESNDDNDTKESSESDTPKSKIKNKKYKRITDSTRKKPSKELQELSKDSLVDLKEESTISGKDKPNKRRLKLLSMWTGPKKHRMASLNAIAKVHCLYENESRTHMELGLMKTVDRQIVPGSAKLSPTKKKESKESDSTSDSEYERRDKSALESSEDDTPLPNTRTLRVVPGIRSAGKYWDPKSSTSSSEDSELDYKRKINISPEKKKTAIKTSTTKSDAEKLPAKIKKISGPTVKKKRNRNEVVMDLKDMVVQKRMASLNATAILAASYEKRSPKSSKDDSTSDSCSDESFSQNPKNGVNSGVKSETKSEEPKKEIEESPETDNKQKVEVVVNQDTDVTITGVYSTHHHHQEFCTVAGMQYRISSTSHTQTTATANCEKEGCSREESGARYTPLSALSSMQPPAEHSHGQPVPELGGLTRRGAGCSSAFTAPSPTTHHEPGKMASPNYVYETRQSISPYGYYQPAGPLIKESSADAERTLARYHPPPHYHPPHAPVLQQYGPYYPPDLCYGRYYRAPGPPYHIPPPPQPDSQMVGVGGEPYPPPQYYGAPPCYQHSPQRVPYIEYRGCPCPMNACPKNVLIGPATGKAPTGGGPADVPSALAPPGAAFRAKVRAACALDAGADTHGSGKDPPLEPEPSAAAGAPHPRPPPAAVGGASPKRELYDARDGLRLAGDTPGPAEAVGPPSPARGSAGVCAPQPPPAAPRRARLGKAMARRSLAGDDTGLLLSAPQPAPSPSHHSDDADDDVLAVSPPACAPIDLSSSDETERRSTPLIDVKKENDGPTYSSPRKPDTQALREHNSTTHVESTADAGDAAKAVKRRYSKPKLEIEMLDVELEDGCKTNGIGEHVKLQKRRKIIPEQSEQLRIDVNSIDKEVKKRAAPKTKKTPKMQNSEKKSTKRKINSVQDEPQLKKTHIDTSMSQDESRTKNIQQLQDKELHVAKTKSALVLDNLIRKNSVDRPDPDAVNINPADLFLSPNDYSTQNGVKKTNLNINNNIVDENVLNNGVRTNTLAAVTQLITKKIPPLNLTCSTETSEIVESKITTHTIKPVKSVLKPPTEKTTTNESQESKTKSQKVKLKQTPSIMNDTKAKQKNKLNAITDKLMKEVISENALKSNKLPAVSEKTVTMPTLDSKSSDSNVTNQNLDAPADKTVTKETKDEREQSLETKAPEKTLNAIKSVKSTPNRCKSVKIANKRAKLSVGKKSGAKEKEKATKLLDYKKPTIKTDETVLVIEEACELPMPMFKSVVRRTKRRRSGAKRPRRVPALIPPPFTDPSRTHPRWSNGWRWDGEHFVSKVYLNNDTRLDLTAYCWPRMTHESGDHIARGDCVLLRASSARAQPFVARVAHLWQNPDDGEMMMSLVWYYRPEHTESGRQPKDAPDEVFASRHRDANSVACIEDKCYVLTYNEYCRYRKRLKAAEEGIMIQPTIVPAMPPGEITTYDATNDSKMPPSISPELVLFCRKVYDFRSKKLQVQNK